MADKTYQLRHTGEQIDNLLDAVLPQHSITVPASGWAGNAAPYRNTVVVPGVGATTVLQQLQLAPASIGNTAAEAAASAWDYLETGVNTVTFYAMERPGATFTVLAKG